MARALDILRSGEWLTRERIRLVAIALLFASTAGFLYMVAKMPYGLALAVWQAATLGLYLLAIGAIMASIPSSAPESLGAERDNEPKYDWLLLALAFPAVLINIGHGQNGFLTAALLGGALVLLDRRPVIAGILIGLLGL